MCGIAGIRHLDGSDVELERLEAMSRALAHRGPDGSGVYRAPGIGLVHRRLAIIAPGPEGRQPMALADGSLHVSFNGEIHNYVELRAELGRAGHAFRTDTDTEVILAAYRLWGAAGFDRFDGPWAFVLWDVERREVLLCRDRFGQRPLFWSRRGERLAFASEAKALLAAFPEERERDETSVQRFLAGDAPYRTEATFFANVRQVEPATVLRVDASGRHEVERYWGFVPGEVESRADDAERLRELLDEAVRLRLRSDAPLGALLSGGLDSGAVVRLAGRTAGRSLRCFSLRYDGAMDESARARLNAADDPAHSIAWVEPSAEHLLECVRRVTWHLDGPSMLRGKIGLWWLHEAAGRELKTTLEGSGSDELFAGYADKYQLPFALDHLRRHRWALHRKQVRRGLVGRHGAAAFAPLALGRRALVFSHHLARRGRSLGHTAGFVAPDYLPTNAVAEAARTRHAWWYAHSTSPFADRLDTALWHEHAYGAMRESVHAHDALAMAHGVETRSPFLSHRLVEFGFGLPGASKISGLRTKAVLREALRDVVPREVLDERRKLGLPSPWHLWCANPAFLGEARALLTSPDARARPWFDAAGVERLLARAGRGTRPYSSTAEALWRLLTLEHWSRDFLEVR